MERHYADPADMPEDERMTAAELRVIREYLGLTIEWLCGHLGVQGRTGRRWEAGTHPIPDGVRLEVQRIEEQTTQIVTAAIAACMDAPDPMVLTYRTDEEYRAHHPEQSWPASWHRAVTARIAQEVPGLEIDYWSAGG